MFLTLLCVCFVFGACQSSYVPEQDEIQELLGSSQFLVAAEKHRDARAYYKSQDELLYQLNQSSLEYYLSSHLRFRDKLGFLQKQPVNPSFERAEDLLRYDDDKVVSFSWQVKSQTIQAPYTASLPESLWHNVFAALYYWNRGSRDGMGVELRRNQEKEQLFAQLETDALDFRSSALMQYLGMIYYRDSRRGADDWRITRDALREVTSHKRYYPRAFPEARMPAKGFQRQSGIVNFCIFTGKGVGKVAQGVRIIKVPGGVGIQFDNGLDAESELGFSSIALPSVSENFSYYQMQIPVMRALENRVRRIVVRVNGELSQELYPLEPFADIRMAVFRRLRAVFLPEQIVSFIVKVIASEALQGVAESGTGSSGIGFLSALAGTLLVNVTAPVPNLRAVGFYPSVAWVGELELGEGLQQVELEYYSETGALLNRRGFEVAVTEGETVILQDYYAQ